MMKRRCIQTHRHTRFSFCLFLVTLTLLLSLPIAEAAKMYWTDPQGIHRADLDGGNVETLLSVTLWSPTDVAVDPIEGKIYWTDILRIQRANLDGTAIENIVTKGVVQLQGIAIDPIGEKIYWADWYTDFIQRANLDGTNIELLFYQPLYSPHGIAVDPRDGKVYWTDVALIRRTNLDGTNFEENFVPDVDWPPQFRVAIDAGRGKLYWTGDGTIRRANVDGTTVATVVSGNAWGIALDEANGKIYWTDWGPGWGAGRRTGAIRRANLGGTHMEYLVTGLDTPLFIALDLPPPTDRVSVQPRGKQPVLWGKIRQNALLQNFPNPFNPETWIPYFLSEDAFVTIRIYNAQGELVRQLALGQRPAGSYITKGTAAYWDGRNDLGEPVSSGVYFYTLEARDFRTERRMGVVR
ncbi:hypothetical protein HYR99_15670 [Candidatus Poribacteria bacterium]|nr:hypothetical protein [Candidatus Poribacteria bacterium]